MMMNEYVKNYIAEIRPVICRNVIEILQWITNKSRSVMGPDEDHPNVDNNGFTNAAAKLAIRYKN